MGISADRQGDFTVIRISGTASVGSVTDARSRLLALLDEERPVRVDLSEASSADVAFLQLVASARRTFAGRALELEILDPNDVLGRSAPGADVSSVLNAAE